MPIKSLIKLLSIPVVKKNLNKISSEIDNDPEIQASVKIIKKHYEYLEKKLKSFCKERPNNPHCKEYK